MTRFKRGVCFLMAALLTFTAFTEMAQTDSYAATAGVSDEAALIEDSPGYAGDLIVEAKNTKKKATPTPTTVPFEAPEGAELTYRACMKGSGWDEEYTTQGNVCGKPGKNLSIEALEIGIKSDTEGKVCCNTYLDGIGWTGEAGNFEAAGDEKSNKPMQRIKIYLTGKLLIKYRIFYRVCLDTNGWLGWTYDGFVAGNEDYNRCIEAIQIVLVEREKGGLTPPNINGVVSAATSSYKDASKIREYMINKAQKYTSKTKYLVLVDSQYCFLGVFKGKKNNWELIKFWICAPGIYKTYWNRDHEIGVKSKGFYSYNCQVYWAVRLHKELWIHSITYKGHNGKTVLDGRLGGRYSHGCIRLATENAKWIYDNVPSYSRCICYKKKYL
ncbi:MAG: L,D-transpeptidase family protein [Clostridiales bacterium]|nr:L,D-transpeptidase family protein [Clostridiales bacterium]